ncbi:MAG: chromosomal replication initiator protein DnaA [Patescibacteria group bacterium]|jgi:chromosomal replication initiator protein|nr:chromosomal replication initiator protein DnaA [Patescibacteria group bacterium]
MQDDTLWQAILGEVELSVTRGSYVTWFKNTKVLRSENDKLVIGVANIFTKQQLETKFKPLLDELVEKYAHPGLRLEFKPHSIAAHGKDNTKNNQVVFTVNSKQTSITPKNTVSSFSHSYRKGINDRYTFDNFIVGSNNELAYAACQAIATNPGTKYNPLFVYGGVGLGKTHLIQAVGNAIIVQKPDARVVYVSSEQFVQEFLEAIRYKKITDFAGHYRSADVLIVDDLQFIAGKEKTQEEFFHTFNALHQANKQIIISSDKPPKNIPTLEERLRSRFEWGMIVDIGTPDFETRCAILQNKANQNEIELPQDVIEFLANHFQSNVRELEGSLNQLLAFCEMRNIEPDVNVAIGVFGSVKSRPKHISVKQIIEKTAKQYSISIDEIVSPKRDKDIVVPRQVAMYLLRSELHLSFPKIAQELGRKDHTTAIHSVEKIEKELHFDNLLKENVNEIKERLYA